MKNECLIYHVPPTDFVPTAEAAGCYCEWGDKVLFLKRHPNKPLGNTWGIPGGKLEPGESPREAVIRELFEEVGLDISTDQLQPIGKLFIRRPHIDYIFHLFRFPFPKEPDLKIALEEHLEGKWVTHDEAKKLPLISGGVEALNFYRQSLNKATTS